MRYMFTMMNNARLSVACKAWRWAKPLPAGLALRHRTHPGPLAGHPDPPAPSPIIPTSAACCSPCRAYVEAMRGLCYCNAQAIDLAAFRERTRPPGQPGTRRPVHPHHKGWCTTSAAKWRRWPSRYTAHGLHRRDRHRQHYRDVRISAVYEGTNGIQAIDLVGRKLGLRGGAAIDGLLRRIEGLDTELADAGTR